MTNLLPASPAILDLRGYRCPIPVIKLERWLREAEDGAQVVVFSDDPIAKVDIPHACAQAGHEAVPAPAKPGECGFRVTKTHNPNKSP